MTALTDLVLPDDEDVEADAEELISPRRRRISHRRVRGAVGTVAVLAVWELLALTVFHGLNSEQALNVPRTWGIALLAAALAGVGYAVTGLVGRTLTPWLRSGSEL